MDESDYFSWGKVFDENKDNLEIHFEKYLNRKDLFECLTELVIEEKKDKIFRYTFNEAAKIIKSSNSSLKELWKDNSLLIYII